MSQTEEGSEWLFESEQWKTITPFSIFFIPRCRTWIFAYKYCSQSINKLPTIKWRLLSTVFSLTGPCHFALGGSQDICQYTEEKLTGPQEHLSQKIWVHYHRICMCLFALCLCSLVKHHVKSFAHFLNY